LRGDQIDLSRSKAEGVKGLKDFLSFAEKGNYVLKLDQAVPNKSTLIEVIYKELSDKGLSVKKYIGTSSYKVDLGIVHPDSAQEYILGILVDGENYEQIHTSNDRELLTPNVLRGLGWNIFRIWTLDWLKNKERILTAILSQVEELAKGKPVRVEPEMKMQGLAEEVASPVSLIAVEEVGSSKACRAYEAAALATVPYANSESIYFPENRRILISQLKEIVAKEAPISKGYLFKKLTRHWNTAKVGSKMQAYLSSILDSIPNLRKTVSHQEFYWTEEMNPSSLDYYRDNSLEKRVVDDIAQEELQVAILEIIDANLSLERVDLIRLTARSFGFLKVGAQIDAVINTAIEDLVLEGKLRVNGEERVTREE